MESYPLYEDRESRRAVERLLTALASGTHGDAVLSAVVRFLKQECLKRGIAHINAFVLVDWCSVLLQQFASSPSQWAKYGLDVALADARVLEMCVGAGTDRRAGRISKSALVSTRRALRAVFRSNAIGHDAFSKLVTSLTAKHAVSTAGNAVFLGVIAGVSARLPTTKPLLESHKQDYYAYYVREIVGSRTQLPDHISNALHDFFESFSTLSELRTEVIAPMEKALLRAPEVVLNDVVSPMILALPTSFDLSEILLSNMLKPLLSNIKSSNPVIRAGALRTFQSLASRSRNDACIDRVVDEVLGPLKQGKVPGADQKALYAQLLSALPQSVPLSCKIPPAIASVALKEPSESAVVAEVYAMTHHLAHGLNNGLSLDQTVTDAFIKGMTDKRVTVKRLWALRAADVWWSLSDAQFTQSDVLSFCRATLPKLVEIWQEVNANPIPSTQNGLVTVAHYVTALLLNRVRNSKDEKLISIFKKSDVVSLSTATLPKPSFILNPKVYSKLSSEEDVLIALRALTTLAPFLVQEQPGDIEDAWAQAFIYFIVAQSVSAKAKSAAKQALTAAYIGSNTHGIGVIMIKGLWSWYRSVEEGDKDSPAIVAKTGSSELGAVLGCICLPRDVVKSLQAEFDTASLCTQAVSLVVLARPEIMPRVSWIDLCIRMGIDPGHLVKENLEDLVQTIMQATDVCFSSLFYCYVADMLYTEHKK